MKTDDSALNFQIEKAYVDWISSYDLAVQNNQELEPYLKVPRIVGSWIAVSRMELQLSGSAIAKKMGISRQAFAKIEKAEDIGAVTLATLNRVAEAMNCELVYAIRPKGGKSYARIYFDKLLPTVLKMPALKNYSQPLRRYAFIAGRLRSLMKSSDTRKALKLNIRPRRQYRDPIKRRATRSTILTQKVN